MRRFDRYTFILDQKKQLKMFEELNISAICTKASCQVLPIKALDGSRIFLLEFYFNNNFTSHLKS